MLFFNFIKNGVRKYGLFLHPKFLTLNLYFMKKHYS